MRMLYLFLSINIMIVLFTLVFALPIGASCPIVRDGIGGYKTGAACSIKNSNLESNTIAGRNDFSPSKERNLRPINPNRSKSMRDSCAIGLCLYKQLLESEGDFQK